MAKDYTVKDIRSAEFTTSSGKDVKDTQMLTGQGKFSSAQNDDNSTEDYKTGAAPSPGTLGGMPK
jgi:hypothetical protein